MTTKALHGRRWAAVDHVTAELGVSERRTCQVLGQHRSTQCKARRTVDDEAALTQTVVDLATQYGRYGYRRITALLQAEGWGCNHKRVERIWRADHPVRAGHNKPTEAGMNSVS